MDNYQFYAIKKVSPIGRFINESITKKMVRLINKYLKEDTPSVLEIGPGKGAIAELLRSSRSIVYKAYEPEQHMCTELQNRGFTVEQARVPPIPEKDATHDTIIMLNVLEHMQDLKDAQLIASEMFRVLRPGGIAILCFPNFLDWGKDFYNLDYTHKFPTTEVNVSQLIRDAGFTVEFVGHQYGCFISDIGRIPNFLAKSLRTVLTWVMPRSIARTEKFQKMGVLFAENIIMVGRKKI